MGESILQEAQRLIHGDRTVNYGHPRDNFKNIADLWTAYLGWEIKPMDIPLMMILLKVARLEGLEYHRDSVTDIAGYAGTIERLQEDDPDDAQPASGTWESMVDVPVDVQVKDRDGDIWSCGPERWWYFHPPEGPAHRAGADLGVYDDSGPFTEIVQEGQQ